VLQKQHTSALVINGLAQMYGNKHYNSFWVYKQSLKDKQMSVLFPQT